MSISVFVVEDDKDLAYLLEHNLKKEGFEVYVFYKGSDVFKALQSKKPDIFILDVMLPDYSGFKIAQSLKSNLEFQGIPIVFLTAKDMERDKLEGFSIGADDYITKPFSMKELIARIRAVLKRSGKLESKGKFRLGNLEIDLEKKEVRRGETKIELTATEFRLLEAMVNNYSRPLSREYLIESVLQKDVYDRTIDVHIKKLREKLGPEGEFIRTVRGFGYKLEA